MSDRTRAAAIGGTICGVIVVAGMVLINWSNKPSKPKPIPYEETLGYQLEKAAEESLKRDQEDAERRARIRAANPSQTK